MSINAKNIKGVPDFDIEPSSTEPGSIEFRHESEAPAMKNSPQRRFELPTLPFSKEALEPYISAETLEYHYGKHHRGYVEKLNQLIQNTDFAQQDIEEIIANASIGSPIFNNAAQTWNHTFYWHSLISAKDYRKPQGELLSAIHRDFGSFDQFLSQFQKAASGVFGSGWAWLVRKDHQGTLAIQTTSNAENPLRSGFKPLLTCDVWEHAYYIDYSNDRAKYLDAFAHILNWEFAERNYEAPWELAA